MIILDTNVLAELMRKKPEGKVLNWVADQSAVSLFTTTITQAEIFYGLELLPKSQKRTALEDAAACMFDEDFAGRVLSFDHEAAGAYARVAAKRRMGGRPISQFDAQILGIAHSRCADIATRKVADFSDCGVKIINPWTVDSG